MSLPFQAFAYNGPPAMVLADSLAYFTAKGTPGAGLATVAAPTTLDGTKPFLVINEPAAVAGNPGKSCYLDYIKLICTSIGTGATSIRWDWVTDALKANPTGGSQLTPVCSRRNAGNPGASCSVFAGPLVAAAPSAQQNHCGGLIRPAAPAIGDTYLIKFGGEDMGVAGSVVPSGTAIADRLLVGPTCIVDPGFTGQLHIWLPGQSAASAYEVEVGFAEFK